MRKVLLIVVLLFVSSLSGCADNSDEIKNMSLVLNDEFSGYFYEIESEPVFLEWESKPLTEEESFLVRLSFPGIYEDGSGYEETVTIGKESRLLILDGNKTKLRLEINMKSDASPFYFFASAKTGSKAVITVTRVRNIDSAVVTESSIEWVRPERKEKPADPILVNSWERDGNYYEYRVKDLSILTFKSFPDASIEKCSGVCDGADTNGRWAWREDIWNYNVKGTNKSVVFERTVSNEKGSSDNTLLAVNSSEYLSKPIAGKSNPFNKVWKSTEKELEILGKTVWCVEQGYRNYSYSKDICTNTLNR
jgi:hypothetical protein